MILNRIIPPLFFLIAVNSGWSQQAGCDCSSVPDYAERLQQGLIGPEYINPVKGYEGNQYLGDWQLGEVVLKNGEIIKDLYLRYDRFKDELLWLRRSDYRKGVIIKENVVAFRLYDERRNLKSVFVKKKVDLPFIDTTDVFLQELVQGKLSLYAYRNVKSEAVEFKLIDNTRHLITNDGKPYFIALRRKSLLNQPFIEKPEMKKVLRRNRMPIRDNELGLVMAISEYNNVKR